MHTASRHGTPSLASLPKDDEVNCAVRPPRSPIQRLTSPDEDCISHFATHLAVLPGWGTQYVLLTGCALLPGYHFHFFFLPLGIKRRQFSEDGHNKKNCKSVLLLFSYKFFTFWSILFDDIF